MTRRIVTAILLTVWTILVLGGVTAYWVTRSVLLAELDRTLLRRATAASKLASGSASAGADGETAAVPVPEEDRYFIKTDAGRTIRPPVDGGDAPDANRLPHSVGFAWLAGGRYRTLTLDLPQGTLVYSTPTEHLDRVLRRLAGTLTVCGLLAGAAAAGVAVAVARATLRPLYAAADVVGDIDERRLDRRIDEPSLPPELRPVASRLNEMLGRLQRAFAQRRRFLADASHELRTPVAALVTTLEVALRRRREPAEMLRVLEACLTDARYLRRLVTTLMEHARAEAAAAPAADGAGGGGGGGAREVFDAADVLGACATVAEALAEGRDVKVVRSFEGPLRCRAEPDRLRSVVTNLLANAVEHNRPGGTVELSGRLEAGALEVVVRDTGPGIAAEHLPHLFQPFYRADTSRRRGDVPNLGLGLFLVESHLKAMGGRCTIESEVGSGTTVRVTVPDVRAAETDVAPPADGARKVVLEGAKGR